MCVMSVIMGQALLSTVQDWTTTTFIPNLNEDLKKAKAEDKRLGQEDCELEDKKRALELIATGLGLKIEFP